MSEDAEVPLPRVVSPPASLLQADPVLRTVRALQARISERFPDASLNRVCAELERVCNDSRERVEWIGRPIWPLRIVRYGLVAIIVIGVLIGVVGMGPQLLKEKLPFTEFIQILEAGLNDVVLIGIGIFTVWNLEGRVKRRRALAALHQLRSIAHVIDMHQLPKDPDRLDRNRVNTKSSPRNNLNAFDLRRYLDYCSEMLSLTGKVAALHLQTLDDAAVVATVNEIETLTTGLSRKIWQKIDLVTRTSPELQHGVG
jgi:hypothetical protein